MVSSINGVSSYANQMNIQSMQQHREKMFNKVDSSSNGSVDQTEFDAFVVKLSERSGTSIDSASAFSTYDSDGDGSLNQDEMDTFIKENAPAPPQGGRSSAGDEGSMSAGGANGMGKPSGEMGMPSPEEMFNNIDTDSDGGISQTELETFTADMAEKTGTSANVAETFSTYDADGDGTLNQDEMDTFMKENAPPPPPPPSSGAGSMQNAISAYTSASGSSSSDSTSSLLAELLDQISSTSSSTGETMDLQNKYISELIQSMGTQSSQYTYSPIDLKA